MKHKSMFRRLLSVLLCLTMVFSLLPTSALAEGLEEPVAAPGEEPAQSDNGSFNLKIEYLSEGKDKLAEAYEVSAAKDAAFEGEVSFPEVSGYRPAKVEFGEVKAENALGAENEVLVYGECANVALNEAKNALVLSGAAVADVHVIVTYAAVAAGEPVEEQPAEEQQPAKAPAKAPLSIVDPVPAIDTYNFVVDGETVSTQRVKEGETVYAPASPEKAGYKFVGWFEGDAAFAAGAKTGVAGIEHTVTARFEEIHYVFFLNDEGVVSTTKEGTNGDVIAADAKFPVDADKAITGWYTDADLTNKVESVTLTDSNIILYPKVETGSWITFNSDGGTYVEPVFVAPGTATVAPAAPARIGYTFQGWYNGNDEFAFGNTLSENVTLTARWQGNANTQYTVIHFQENANDDNYSFAEAETLTGTAGQTTTASAKAYDGFTAQAIEQKTIAGDGSTIVSVYYTRNVCTIYFFPTNGGSSALTCTKEAHTHGWGCYEWQGWNRVLTCTKEEHTHENSCYTYSAEGSLFTITAKQGAYIGDQWPSRSNGSTNWSTKKNGGAPYQAGIDVMPLNGGVFYTPTSESTDNSQTASYYVEVLDGEDGITVSGKKYKLDHTDTVRLSGPTVSDEDFYDITGFTKNKTISTKNGNNYDGAKFYYTRNSYNIKFINNGTVEKTVAKQYQANISDVTYTPNRPAGMPAEYNFVGWYDNELGQGEPYSFTGTMPAQNITVYAKWAAPVFTGIVHMQMAGNGETHTFEIVYGSKIDESKLPEIAIPEGYTWRGWATRDEQGNYTPFNFETEIYADITLYPYYTSNQAFTVSYGAGEGSGTVPVDAKRYADGSYADVMAATGLTAPEGKVFLGWETDGKVYQPGDKIAVHASNIVLTAVWGDKASTAVVTYHANGGVGDDETSACPNNSEITLIANPFTREGYEFIGWATAPVAAAPYMRPGYKVVVDNTPSNDFYAMWKQANFTLTIDYEYADGSTAKPTYTETVTSGADYNVVSPVIPGYTADIPVVSGTMPGEDVTVTVKYTENGPVTIEYKATTGGSVSLEEESVAPATGTAQGSTATADAEHYFVNWTDKDGNVVSTDATFVPGKNASGIYEAATYTANFAEKTEVNVTITGATLTKTYDGNPYTADGFTVVGELPEGVTITAKDGVPTVTRKDAGTTNMGLTADSFNINNVPYDTKVVITDVTDGYVTINPRNVTLTSATDSKPYDGTALTNDKVTVGGDGFVEGEGATYAVTGSRTLVGSSKNTFTYALNEGTNADNYNITKTEGTLTVTDRTEKYEITVVANSATETYDGTEKSVNGFKTLNFDVNGVTYTVEGLSAEAKGTDAGEYTANVTGTAAVKDAAGNDVTAQFTVTTVDGKLTITPVTDEVTVTITGNTASKVYNATEQSVTGFTTDVGEKTINVALADGVTAEAKGTDVGTYKMGLTEESFVVTSKNYSNIKVAVVDGTLDITPITDEVTVTITGNSAEKIYNAAEQSVTGYTTDVGDKAITVALAEGKSAEAKGTDVGTYYMGLTEESFVVTSKNYSNIKVAVVDGTLDITPITDEVTVTITGNSASKVYTGSEQSVTGYTVSDYDSSITLTGPAQDAAIAKGTNVGTYEMGLKAEDFSASSDNYTSIRVEVEDGWLKITNASIVAKFTGESKSVTYNGKEQEITGITAEGLLEGHEYENLSYSAKGTDADTYNGVFSGVVKIVDANGTDVTENYAVETVPGTLTITPVTDEVTVTITGNNDSQVYDGKAHDVTGYKVSISNPLYTEGDFSFSGTASASGTNVDTYKMGLSADMFANTSKNFSKVTFNVTDGYVTINPRPVTVTGDGWDVDQLYTGGEYKKETYTFANVVEGQTASISYSIKGTEVGEYTGKFGEDFLVMSGEDEVTANYELTTKTPGTLKIVASAIKDYVTLTTADVVKTYDGTAYTAGTATATDKNGKTVKVEYSVNGIDWTENPAEITATNVADSVTVQVRASVEGSYEGYVTGTQKLTINPRNVTLTSATDSKPYDGTALTNGTVTVSGDGFVKDEGATYDVTGSQLDVGESANTFEYTLNDGTKAGNYNITKTEGKLTVTANENRIVITANSNSKTYDGTALTDNGYSYTENVLAEGDVLTAVVEGSQTDAGSSENVVTSYMVMRGETDVTANYTFGESVNGTLTVSKATLTVTTPTATKVYDGTALTAEGSITGFVNGETATFKTTGSRTEVGTSDNTYTLTWDGTAKQSNYTVSETIGTLTVSEYADEITVTTTGGEFTYDGKTHGATVAVSELPKGYTLETASSNATATDVTTEDVVATCDTLVIKNAEGKDVTSELNIKYVDGSIKINPATLTVTTPTATKVYDGTALTAEGSITGFVNGETATFVTTGSRTEVGTSDNTYTLTWDGTAKQSNYTITETIGTLTVYKQSIDPKDPTEPDPENPDQPVYGGVEIGNLADVVYNGESQAQKPTVTDKDGNALDEDTDYTLAWSADTVNVGTVTVTVTGIGNYSGTVERTYEITPRPVTVAANSTAKTFGTADPALTATVTGLIGTDTVAYTLTRAEGEAVGNYAITAAGDADQGNYKVTYVPGTLTITAQSINPVDPENPDPNYNGVEIGNLADVVYNGESQAQKPTVTDKDGNALTEGTDYTLAWSADTVNVGTVTVTVTGIGNYAGTVERTYEITPRPVTVAANSTAKTFGTADPALTATVTGLIGTDTVEYTLTRAAGEAVGNYAITPAGDAAQGNYKVTYVPGIMVITAFIDDAPILDIPPIPPLPEGIDDELTPLGGPEVTVDDPVNIDDEATPLAGEHQCCILHFLILCAALLIELLYINDKKKRQQKIFEMRRELNK